MKTTVELQCPIAGMEGVTLVFNMMATQEEWDAFMKTSAREGSRVASVEGWDSDEWGDEPFAETAPVAFHMWLPRAATEALRRFASDPELVTGSSRSTKATNAAPS